MNKYNNIVIDYKETQCTKSFRARGKCVQHKFAHACTRCSEAKNPTVTRRADESEKVIERYLTKRMAELKLPCLKYSNPNMIGYPDRLLVLPGGRVIWVELKSKGRKPSKVQEIRIAELRAIGHDVMVIDNKGCVDDLINAIEV